MPKNNNKKRVQIIDVGAIITKVFSIIFAILLITGGSWYYISIYNPQQKKFIKKSRIAYNAISEVIYDIYKEKQRVYDRPDEPTDSVCEILAEKLADKKGTCRRDNTAIPKFNFKIKKTNIEIYGLERIGEVQNDNIIKEFIIDIDGESKGKNEIGVDRVPVQIHSTGRMGGKLMPVNCNPKDLIEYGMQLSKSCPVGTELNFLTSNIPFGFDVNQIGSKEGKIKKVTLDVSFVRADCAAFGGDIIADDYCNEKGIYWLKRCYEEYYCGIEPTHFQQ